MELVACFCPLLFQLGPPKALPEFLVWPLYQFLLVKKGFPSISVGKELACNAGDPGSISGSGRYPGEGNGNLTPVLLPGEFQGQRSLEGYKPWDHKETRLCN